MQVAKQLAKVKEEEYKEVNTVLSKKVGKIKIRRLIREPEGHISLEYFLPCDVISMGFWHAECHYVLGGKAKITYSVPPLHQRTFEVVVETGDAILYERGDQVTWEVLGNEPYCHICFIMPAVPLPTGDQLVAKVYKEYTSP